MPGRGLRARPIVRLIAVNGLIRLAGAASGQLFAFLLASRVGDRGGVGPAIVGAVGAAFFIAELGGAPFAGHIADRVGPWRVLRYAPLFGTLSLLTAVAGALSGTAAATLAAALLLARLVEGLSAACAVPTTLTLLARRTEGDFARRTRVMGALEVTSLLGMIAGFAVAGAAWDAYGVKAFFTLAPAYAGVWLLVIPERTEAPLPAENRGDSPHTTDVPGVRRSGALDALRRTLATRAGLAFAGAWLAVNAVVGAWIQQAPYLLSLASRSPTQSLVGGFSGREVGTIFGVWGLTFLSGIAGWSVFGARLPRRHAMLTGLVGMLGVVAALWAANHGAGAVAVIIAAGFVLVESGFTPAAFSHLADLTATHDAERGAALGIYSLLLGGGQLAGNALGAVASAAGQMDGLLALTGLLAVAAFAALVIAGRPVGRTTDSRDAGSYAGERSA